MKKYKKKIKRKKRVLLDMSCSLIHHGHIRLIKKAARYGDFILNQHFLDKNNIDIVVQGSDYKKRGFSNKVVTFSRTKNISSTMIRRLAKKNINRKK